MTLARSWSVGLRGVDGEVVEIEADLGPGLPGIALVGLPDTALHESRDRIRAAVLNTGESWPGRRITLALSPATLPKQGSGYDLALAVAVLAAAGEVPAGALQGTVLLGELALDGRLRGVRGVLPSLLAARRAGVTRVVVPHEALEEASVVAGVQVLGARCLGEALAWLRGRGELDVAGPAAATTPDAAEDLTDVVEQDAARRALEVAAAGGHHLFLSGPPGSGKTMLARRMTGILPPLDLDEALQVAAVRSLAGALAPDAALRREPPFVAPHHSVSVAALVGGGTGTARPGAVSLAHRGVLFLDEVLEFGPRLLETLRTPLEEGEVRLARRDGVVTYPARFQLVLAANPCPCAPARPELCSCPPVARGRYERRLSGPMLDRVDLRVALTPVSSLSRGADGLGTGESSSAVRARVAAARAAARERWRGTGWRTNADVPGPALRRLGALPAAVTAEAETALRSGLLTARGADRALRVSWTVADLRGATVPDAGDVTVAIALRRREQG